MTPLGITMTPLGVARERIDNNSLRTHSGICQGPCESIFQLISGPEQDAYASCFGPEQDAYASCFASVKCQLLASGIGRHYQVHLRAAGSQNRQ